MADDERLPVIAGRERLPASASVPFVVDLPFQPPRPAPRTERPVPDVTGLELRDAVRALHESGFRVVLLDGRGGTTSPAAGTTAPAGAIIRLYHRTE